MLVYYGLIYPHASANNPLSLSLLMMLLLMLTTVIIAGAGYIVNDLHDVETDRINKKEKQIIGIHISSESGWRYYFALVLIGAIISLYIAIAIDKQSLFLIYPAATLLLYLYSRYFKPMILVGNFVVSLFLAGVPLILWLAESELISHLSVDQYYTFSIKMGCFILFAFLLNLKRELIKDIEDIEGDRNAGLYTYPIKYGLKNSKRLMLLYTLITVLSLLLIMFLKVYSTNIAILAITIIIVPLLLVFYKIYNSSQKSEWHAISNYYKMIMAAGMIIFIL